VAVLVVDGFKIVQVEKSQDERLLCRVVSFNPSMKRFIEAGAIGDTGQSVDGRFFASLFQIALKVFDAAIQLRVARFVPSLLFVNNAAELLALDGDLPSKFLDILVCNI
jgi:hypothetical protein